MTTTDISARLRALASDDKHRPETARLRDVFNDVERALKAGVKQSVVLAELHKSGFTMTMASFKSALQRIRKERAEGALPASSSSPTAQETSKTEPNTKVEKPDLGVGGENPMETNQGGTGSEKPKIRTRKDLRNAKKSGNEETDQFIN